MRTKKIKTLKYHVNAAQSRDVSFLVDNIVKQGDKLKDFEILIVASTILDYSRDRMRRVHTDC